MSNKNLIQVFEYEKLKYDEHTRFQKKHFDAMVKFNELHNNKYFNPVFKGIKFKNYVGVIQVSGLTIEILPKADHSNHDNATNKDLWQNVLLNMLKVCKYIQVDNVSEAVLKKRYNSILEVYFDLYLREIEYLVKRGLIKKYRRKQSNQLALKGKLLFAQNIQKNAVHKERFYCEHPVYDRNHLLHQILLQGLWVLESLNTFYLQDKIKRLLFHFEGIRQRKITATHFKTIKLNRQSQAYHKALNIAKMLILNYSPNINSGNDNMLTLLFDMNKLWEEYIYRVLNKHKPEGYEVLYQKRIKFWDRKEIRPDIIISNEMNNENFVLDTKWKSVSRNDPSDNDLKQMFVYNLYCKAEKSMLLYPQTDPQTNHQFDSAFGKYQFVPQDAAKNQCKLGFISVLEEGKIKDREKLSKEIFKKLNISNKEN